LKETCKHVCALTQHEQIVYFPGEIVINDIKGLTVLFIQTIFNMVARNKTTTGYV